jgi:hypothetical protein
MADSHTVTESTVFVNKQMLDAIISSIIVLFHDEFTQNGLYVNFGSTSKFIISIISINAAAEATKRNNSMTVFDAKMAYIRNIVEKIYDLCLITLQILDKDGNLVICFSFEEQ